MLERGAGAGAAARAFRRKTSGTMAPASLEAIRQAGVSRYGELDVSAEQLEAWLTRAGRDLADGCAADAYLACGVLAGTGRALAAFERHVTPELRAALEKMGVTGAAVDELLQVTRTKLLVAGSGEPAGLSRFNATGSLVSFCTTAAARQALSRTRDEATRQSYEARSDGAPPTPLSPERALAKQQQAQRFESAFVAALRTLSAEDRALLRLNLVEGVPHEKLAAAQGVSRVTITRRLLEARARLAQATRTTLSDDASHSQAAESLLRSIESNFDVSMHRLLVEADDGKDPSRPG